MNPVQPPSFEPWLGRVRIARAWAAVVGFVIVSVVSHGGGLAWDESLLRGFGGAIALYFVGWASALFLFGELFNVQVQRTRDAVLDREAQRHRQLQDLYDTRMRELHGTPTDVLQPVPFDQGGRTAPTTGYAPPLRDAA